MKTVFADFYATLNSQFQNSLVFKGRSLRFQLIVGAILLVPFFVVGTVLFTHLNAVK